MSYNWSNVKYWLAIIVFIIIFAFAVYIKYGRKKERKQ